MVQPRKCFKDTDNFLQRASCESSKLKKYPTVYSHTTSYVLGTFHHTVIIVFASPT